MGVFFLLFWVMPLLLMIVSVVGIIWIWTRVLLGRRQRITGDGLARCGQCNYPTRGVSGFTCPECGADMRETGIVTDRQRRRPIGPLAYILTWTLCMPLPALFVAILLIAFGPKNTYQNESITLTPIHSGQYTSIDLSYSPASMYSWLEMFFFSTAFNNPMNLAINGSSNQHDWVQLDPVTMTYDASFSSYHLTNPSNTTSTATSPAATSFDKAALLAMMSSSGADITQPQVIAEADELFQIIKNYPTAGMLNLNPTLYTVSYRYSYPTNLPKGWWVALCFAMIPVAWVAGIGLYFLARGRRVAGPNHPSLAESPPPADSP